MHAVTPELSQHAERNETAMTGLPTIFLSHGAPTWAIEPGIIAPRLAALANGLPRPRAILVVSPHWTSRELRVMTSTVPETVHDFSRFPRALYQLQYPAPGAPALAQSVMALLAGQGYTVRADAETGFDHGAWVPLLHMYPKADVPVTQLSMRAGNRPFTYGF